MGKRRHSDVETAGVVGAAPLSSSKETPGAEVKKRKKRKSEKLDIENGAVTPEASSVKKERKERKSSGKKAKKEKKDRKYRDSESTNIPLSTPDASNHGGEVVGVNDASEPALESAGKDSDRKKKKEKKKKDGSGHKKDRKDTKESGKKKRRKSEAAVDNADANEVDGNGALIDLAQSDKGDEATVKGKAKDAKDNANKVGLSETAPSGDNSIDVVEATPALNDDLGDSALPTVEDILKKAATKRNAFLHGYAALPLFSSEHLKALGDKPQGDLIGATAEVCERLMHLIHDTVTVANQWAKPDLKDDTMGLEESVVSDMLRLKKVPLAKQYVEMTLWRRVAQMNRDHLLAASRLGFGKGFAEDGGKLQGKQGLLLHRENDPDAKFVSYREAYMKSIVEQYSDSLEKMREAESMDADRVQFLLRCLDSGASLFANLKCLEKKE